MQRGFFIHQAQGLIAARFQAQVHPLAAGFLHKVSNLSIDARGAGKTAPFHPPAKHTLAKLAQQRKVQGEVIIGDPQLVVSQLFDLLDLLEYHVQIAFTVQMTENRAGAEITIERAAQSDHDRGGVGAIFLHPRILVGSMVEPAPVRDRKAAYLLQAVMDDGVIHQYIQVSPIQARIMSQIERI